ncbi:MAG: hypothetical protein KJ623_00045 [Nanoarchaeota archaeon]|nr:hypothetical protein [Nanoarchaeota archaeon]MBU0962357.1 hypothetical protein [Nanoarchaeota archaeon]
MYIRTKRIKKEDYAYLVSSKWNRVKKTSKQVFSKYLGKVYTPNKQYNLSLKDIKKIEDIDSYIDNTSTKEIIRDIITLDVLNHNLIKNKEIYELEDIYVDLNNLKVYNQDFKPCVIKMNNGYLCDYTLKNLFEIMPSSTDELAFGKKLARAFIESGIGIEKEFFVLIFDKIYKKEVT